MSAPNTPVATPGELSTYLGSQVDEDRATLLINLAQGIAEAYVSPLPANSKAVILAAVARAYANPQQVTSETIGPYSSASPFPGLYFTTQERRILGRMAGHGGAFTIDPTPVDAATGLPPWDTNTWGPLQYEGTYFDEDPNTFDDWLPS